MTALVIYLVALAFGLAFMAGASIVGEGREPRRHDESRLS